MVGGCVWRAKRGQTEEGDTDKVRNWRREIKRRWKGMKGKEGHGARGREKERWCHERQ